MGHGPLMSNVLQQSNVNYLPHLPPFTVNIVSYSYVTFVSRYKLRLLTRGQKFKFFIYIFLDYFHLLILKINFKNKKIILIYF